MVCPCCQPECEEDADCAYGECCVNNKCECTCLSIGGVAAMEGMTVTFEGKEFVVGAPDTSSQEAIECDPDDEFDDGFWSADTLDGDATFFWQGCKTRCGPAQVSIWDNKVVNIGCIMFPAEGCPYWSVNLSNNCRQCIPDAEAAPFEYDLYREWTAKIDMDENCLPTGEPYDLVLDFEYSLSIGGAGDCDPQPPSFSFGNPLP